MKKVFRCTVAVAMAVLCCAGCSRKNKETSRPSPTETAPTGTHETENTLIGTEPSDSGVLDWDTVTNSGGSLTTEPNNTQPTGSTRPTGSTQPTESTQPIGSTQPTESTQPTGSTQPTESTQPTGSTQTTAPEKLLTWEQYEALSNEEKQTYFRSFSTVDAFYQWQDAAKKEYADREAENNATGSGFLDIKDYS